MAVKCLEEIVSTILAPVPQEPAVHISDGIKLDLANSGDPMRDYTMTTAPEVMLWVLSANSLDPQITGSYSYVSDVADSLVYRSANMYDIHSIYISAVCTDLEVFFANAHIVYVMANDEKTVCNEMTFHKGDFILSTNGKQTGVVSGVW